MSLIALQCAFHAQIVADDDAVIASDLRYDIYRNNYRTQLLTCLESLFEKTRALAGEDAFEAAACHHIITHPPTSWSLDDYGHDFPATLAELFAEDGDVAELAWLEWAMQLAFSARDKSVLDLAWLTTEGLDLDAMRFALAPGFQMRQVVSNVVSLWEAAPGAIMLDHPADLIVWRKGHVAQFRLVEPDEMALLNQIAAGHSFGEISARLASVMDDDAAIAHLGGLLGRWLSDGLLCLDERLHP
jgi:hypothetical protein